MLRYMWLTETFDLIAFLSRFSTTPGAAVRIHDVSTSVGSMLIDFAYSLQIHLSKQNLADVENAARILGFLEVEELCKKVFKDLI